MQFQDLVFYIAAFLLLAASAGAVMLRNIIYAAVSLLFCFGMAAVLFILLGAEYLAAVQILVYTGAIAVVMVMAIMITKRKQGKMNETNRGGHLAFWAGTAAFPVAFVLFTFFAGVESNPVAGVLVHEQPADYGTAFLSTYLIPFEITAFMLTVAAIAAIVILKGSERSD